MGSYWCFFSAAAAVPGPGRASIAASVGAQKFSLSLSLSWRPQAVSAALPTDFFYEDGGWDDGMND